MRWLDEEIETQLFFGVQGGTVFDRNSDILSLGRAIPNLLHGVADRSNPSKFAYSEEMMQAAVPRQVLAKREASTRVSSWHEYLCVRNLSRGKAIVEICGYEGLGEWVGEDDQGNEIAVPEAVDGKLVVGVEDGYLVGGELECWREEDAKEYTERDIDAVFAWISSKHYSLDSEIERAVRRALAG